MNAAVNAAVNAASSHGAPMAPRRWRVHERRVETADTVTIVIVPDDPSQALDPPRPGQFAMLSAWGAHEIPVSYSAVEPSIEHTVRSVGPASEAVFALRVGDPLGVRGPFGTGWDLGVTDDRDVVVVAGGIGLAPLRPLVRALVDDDAARGRTSVLIGARTPAEVCFGAEIAEWSERGLTVEVTVDAAVPTTGPRWYGRVGLVTRLLDLVDVDPRRTTAFVCGPEVMMRASVHALGQRGVGAESILVSGERNMKCAIGHCGHCQLGGHLLCRDGAVMPASILGPLMAVREL